MKSADVSYFASGAKLPHAPQPAARPRRARWVIPASLLILALLVLAHTGCDVGRGSQTTEVIASEVLVRTAPVLDTVYVQPIVAVGVLGSKDELPLAFKIGGVVSRVEVEEGQTVRAGQPLAELEQPEIDAQVAKAEAALEMADRELTRARTLVADSVISQEQLEAAVTSQRVAASDLRIARFDQRHATIVAPAGGTVLHRLADPGQTVAPGAPILILGAASRGQVVLVNLTDRDIVRVASGDRSEVTFDAFPDDVLPGRVEGVGAAAAPTTGTYEVEIRLEALPFNGPASGLIGRVTIRPSRGQRVKLLPVEALLEGDGDHASVWSLSSSGTPEYHRVQIAFLANERVAVRDGLDGIAEVVTEGSARLTPGARVRVVR